LFTRSNALAGMRGISTMADKTLELARMTRRSNALAGMRGISTGSGRCSEAFACRLG
jgi:hypothetical protein